MANILELSSNDVCHLIIIIVVISQRWIVMILTPCHYHVLSESDMDIEICCCWFPYGVIPGADRAAWQPGISSAR